MNVNNNNNLGNNGLSNVNGNIPQNNSQNTHPIDVENATTTTGAAAQTSAFVIAINNATSLNPQTIEQSNNEQMRQAIINRLNLDNFINIDNMPEHEFVNLVIDSLSGRASAWGINIHNMLESANLSQLYILSFRLTRYLPRYSLPTNISSDTAQSEAINLIEQRLVRLLSIPFSENYLNLDDNVLYSNEHMLVSSLISKLKQSIAMTHNSNLNNLNRYLSIIDGNIMSIAENISVMNTESSNIMNQQIVCNTQQEASIIQIELQKALKKLIDTENYFSTLPQKLSNALNVLSNDDKPIQERIKDTIHIIKGNMRSSSTLSDEDDLIEQNKLDLIVKLTSIINPTTGSNYTNYEINNIINSKFGVDESNASPFSTSQEVNYNSEFDSVAIADALRSDGISQPEIDNILRQSRLIDATSQSSTSNISREELYILREEIRKENSAAKRQLVETKQRLSDKIDTNRSVLLSTDLIIDALKSVQKGDIQNNRADDQVATVLSLIRNLQQKLSASAGEPHK